MLKEKKLRLLAFVVLLSTLFVFSQPTYAAKLSLQLEASSTSSFHYSMKVDHVSKLAGLKVIITHDKKLFKFVKAHKSKVTNSFMHIVNARKEGQVIIVMASAKGIGGKNVELMSLEYESIARAANTNKPVLLITQCQLMGEDLKEISCSFND